MTRWTLFALATLAAAPAFAQGEDHDAAVLMGQARAAAALHDCEKANALRDEAMAKGAKGARLVGCDPEPQASPDPAPVTAPAVTEQSAVIERPWGLSFNLTNDTTAGFSFLRFVDPAVALDVHLGITVTSTSIGDMSKNDWTATPQVGIRIYSGGSNRVRVYGEPSVGIGLNVPVDPATDTHATNYLVAGVLGVEYEVFPGFSLGAQTGVQLSVLNADDELETSVVNVGAATTGASATIYW